MSNRFEYHQQLFNSLDTLLRAFLEKDPDHDTESRQETEQLLNAVNDAMRDKKDYADAGQKLLCRLVSHFPAFTPHIQRDLFWFFGGDCLHFMADDEMEKFQLLEEKFYQESQSNQDADYADIRAQVFGLH